MEFWRFRSGAPWAKIPERYGPSTTCYNRFVRWRKAGVWDRLLAAVSASFNGELVMIDSTCMRVHQHGATGKKAALEIMAWDVPGAASRPSHALVDADGRPVSLRLTGGQVHDAWEAEALIEAVAQGATLLGDKGYDSTAIRQAAAARNIGPTFPIAPIASSASDSRPGSTAAKSRRTLL